MFFCLLEFFIPQVQYQRSQNQSLSHFRILHTGKNMVFALINAAIGFILAALLLFLFIEWSQQNLFGLNYWLKQWLDISYVAEFVLLFILFDAWQYIWHRLNHRIAFFWRFHSIHHADRHMDPSTGLRFHFGEVAMSVFARLAVMPLLGMQLHHLLIYELIALPLILFHHSNICLKTRLDYVLKLVVVTPAMHRVHHSAKPTETDTNYGSVLSIWDRLFGSYALRSDVKKISLGLSEISEQQQNRISDMLMLPFQKNETIK